VSCAAGLAATKVVLKNRLMDTIAEKEMLFRNLLKHRLIKEVRGRGLFLAVELGDTELLMKFVFEVLKNGVLTDWFLFNDTSFRITPPLIITEEQIKMTCKKIIKTLDTL
jgi:acetylornithine/succinyldiaminopimelate/putrescine aminotransferase